MAPILQVQGLKTYFNTRQGVVRAVDDVSFTVNEGETVGIAGESGSGKSVTALSIMRLLPMPPAHVAGGQILHAGENILLKSDDAMARLRGSQIAMIFQDPMTSLNPVLTIGHQIAETYRFHEGMERRLAWERAIEMLRLVRIPDPERRAREYPHQFSGGMRQRVMIAIALSLHPRLLIADEPTTALDVTIQAQVLHLLRELTSSLNTAVIVITHDLGVLSALCDRIIIMYAGRIVEMASASDLFQRPAHPYSAALLRSVPRLDWDRSKPLDTIRGRPPLMLDRPSGCAFHPRCEFAGDICRQKTPVLTSVSVDGHLAACWKLRGDNG